MALQSLVLRAEPTTCYNCLPWEEKSAQLAPCVTVEQSLLCTEIWARCRAPRKWVCFQIQTCCCLQFPFHAPVSRGNSWSKNLLSPKKGDVRQWLNTSSGKKAMIPNFEESWKIPTCAFYHDMETGFSKKHCIYKSSCFRKNVYCYMACRWFL